MTKIFNPGNKFCKVLCFILIIVLMSYSFSVLQPARAVIAATSMAIIDWTLTAMGITFASTGDMQSACDAIYQQIQKNAELGIAESVAALNFINNAVDAVVEGNLYLNNLEEDLKSGFLYFWGDIADSLHSDTNTIPVADLDITMIQDTVGTKVHYFNSIPTNEWERSAFTYQDVTVDCGDYTLRYYVNQDASTGYALGGCFIDQVYDNGSVYHYCVVSGGHVYYKFCFYKANLWNTYDSSYHDYIGIALDKTLDGSTNYSTLKYCTPSLIISLDQNFLIPAEKMIYTTGTTDIPYEQTGEYGSEAVKGALTEVMGYDDGLVMDLVGTGVMADVEAMDYDTPLTATQTGVLTDTGALTGEGDLVGSQTGEGTLDPDLDTMVLPSVSDLFPFCIPFDLIALVGALNATPESPVFKIPIDFSFVGYEDEIEIDMSKWDNVTVVIRWGVVIFFILGLVIVTRKMIKG